MRKSVCLRVAVAGLAATAAVALGAATVAARSVGVAISSAASVHPVPGAPAQLYGVACSSAAQCYAVGFAKHAGAVVPIKNGVPSAAETVRGTSTLQGIACGGGDECVAVGQNSKQLAVVLGLTGGAIGAAQQVAPKAYVLGTVACPAATNTCEAGGSDQGELVETTNGAPTDYQPIFGFGFVFGIACGSATVCEAVGNSAPGNRGLIESIIGGAPQSQHKEPGQLDLESIACPTPTTCVAVGGFAPPHAHEGTVVTISNGKLGKVHLVSGTADLSAVACPTPSTCEALGDTPGTQGTARGVGVTIKNGVPGRRRVLPEQFDALACPGPARCIAVGNAAKKPYRAFVGTLRVA